MYRLLLFRIKPSELSVGTAACLVSKRYTSDVGLGYQVQFVKLIHLIFMACIKLLIVSKSAQLFYQCFVSCTREFQTAVSLLVRCINQR